MSFSCEDFLNNKNKTKKCQFCNYCFTSSILFTFVKYAALSIVHISVNFFTKIALLLLERQHTESYLPTVTDE